MATGYAGCVATGCADVATGCAAAATGCADVATGCAAAATGCADVATGCAAAATGCADVATGCADVATGCADVATGCADVATGCAAAATGCANVATGCAAAATGCAASGGVVSSSTSTASDGADSWLGRPCRPEVRTCARAACDARPPRTAVGWGEGVASRQQAEWAGPNPGRASSSLAPSTSCCT